MPPLNSGTRFGWKKGMSYFAEPLDGLVGFQGFFQFRFRAFVANCYRKKRVLGQPGTEFLCAKTRAASIPALI